MRFREVIAPPVWLLAFIYFLFTSMSISIWAAIGNNPALWCQIILTVALVFIYIRWRMVIEKYYNNETFDQLSQNKHDRGQGFFYNDEDLVEEFGE